MVEPLLVDERVRGDRAADRQRDRGSPPRRAGARARAERRPRRGRRREPRPRDTCVPITTALPISTSTGADPRATGYTSDRSRRRYATIEQREVRDLECGRRGDVRNRRRTAPTTSPPRPARTAARRTPSLLRSAPRRRRSRAARRSRRRGSPLPRARGRARRAARALRGAGEHARGGVEEGATERAAELVPAADPRRESPRASARDRAPDRRSSAIQPVELCPRHLGMELDAPARARRAGTPACTWGARELDRPGGSPYV